MTPQELYDLLNRKYPGNTAIICDLHSACLPKRGHLCKIPQKYEIMNFDEVKKVFDRNMHGQHKSVDAVAVSVSKEKFCFIELKSWQELWNHKGTVEAIQAQAEKYKDSLPQKLTDSMTVCTEVVGNSDLFADFSVVYLFVTDIDVNYQPLESLASNLNVLAGTSSDWMCLCNKLSRGILSRVKDVSTYYEQCKNFDKLIETL